MSLRQPGMTISDTVLCSFMMVSASYSSCTSSALNVGPSHLILSFHAMQEHSQHTKILGGHDYGKFVWIMSVSQWRSSPHAI